jgi:glycine oxidase
VLSSAGRIAAGSVVIAAGAWSTPLLPTPFPEAIVEPVRGQMVLFRQATPTFRRVIECGRRYLVPRDDGRVLCGATEERAGFDVRTTPEAIDSLTKFARALVPALESAEVERSWAGLRPYAPAGRPFIGGVPGYRGLYLAAGHFRAGLHLSPITARLIRDAVLAGGWSALRE